MLRICYQLSAWATTGLRFDRNRGIHRTAAVFFHSTRFADSLALNSFSLFLRIFIYFFFSFFFYVVFTLSSSMLGRRNRKCSYDRVSPGSALNCEKFDKCTYSSSSSFCFFFFVYLSCSILDLRVIF